MQDSSIREALQEGIHYIYSEMFDPNILFFPYFSSEEDLYLQQDKTMYDEPIPVAGKVTFQREVEKSVHEVEDRYTPTIKVSKKGFPFEVEGNENFIKKSMFRYKGKYYKAFSVEYTNLIQGEPLTYSFICKEDSSYDENE